MAEEGFTINKAYAEKYNKWRQKEELQKLKDKYGDVSGEETDSSSSETEDEDAEALTSQLEKDWLRTLSALKRKDPKIYKKDFNFYETEGKLTDKQSKKKEKQKPLYLKDYERKVILEKEGHLSSESESDDEDQNINVKPGYYEEQEQIKNSFKSALDSEEESDDTDLFTKRTKSKAEQNKEEEEYLDWLKGQKTNIKDEQTVGIELESLKSYWSDPKLEDGEKFLRDYILNKQYLDKDSDRIPTYDEVVDDGEGFSEEESILDKQEEFERKYNFRFEEPDQEFIKSYPRTLTETVRRKDTKRAEKRKEIKERKKQEKEKRKEELKQLKNLKKREISDKITKLKEISGNPSFVVSKEDLEEDFDPKKHDEMMQKYFKDDYYDTEIEDKKPVFSDEEDLDIEDWDNWQGVKDEEEKEEDSYHGDEGQSQNFNMDADFDPEEEQTTKRGKKRKSVFAKALKKKKPVFDPAQKTFDDYFDEYYKLDYEDVAGDVPCRFKYRKVIPNDFGLSVNEMLKCREKELNAWASIKKMSQYRTEEEETMDVKIYTNKSKNMNKKMKILTSLQEEQQRKEEREKKMEKVKKKKQKKKPHTATSAGERSDAFDHISDYQSHDLSHELQNERLVVGIEKSEEGSAKEGSFSKKKNIENNKSKKTELLDDKHSDSSQSIALSKKQKRKKKKKKLLANVGENSSLKSENVNTKDKNKLKIQSGVKQKVDVSETGNESKKRRKKKNKGKPAMSDERLLAYGINPKKFKYMKFDKFKEKNHELKRKYYCRCF